MLYAPILAILITLSAANHVFNRFGRNREYEMAKIAQQKPSANVLVNENPILTANQTIELKDNQTLNRSTRSNFQDIYRFSLSSHNPTHKVISVIKDIASNDSIVFLSTYISYRDNQGYPFVQKITSDQIFLYSLDFQQFCNFLLSLEKTWKLMNEELDILYIATKHVDGAIFNHLSITMKEKIGTIENTQTQKNETLYKYRSIWLSTDEYKYLISRMSQIQKDINL